MDDELGQRLELETATPEPAGIGEERSSGDAGHVGVSCIHRDCGSWGGARRRRASGSGVWESGAEQGTAEQTPAARRGSGERSWGGRRDSGGGGWLELRGEDDVRLRHVTNYLLLLGRNR